MVQFGRTIDVATRDGLLIDIATVPRDFVPLALKSNNAEGLPCDICVLKRGLG